MVRVFTVDASVFLNAFLSHEAGHEESARLLAHLRKEGASIVAPTLLLPEVAGAIARGQDDPDLGQQLAAGLERLSSLLLVRLDVPLARQAAAVAAQHRLRGSDAVYGAVALQFGSTLVTRDREQRERLAAVLPTRSPAEALADDGG